MVEIAKIDCDCDIEIPLNTKYEFEFKGIIYGLVEVQKKENGSYIFTFFAHNRIDSIMSDTFHSYIVVYDKEDEPPYFISIWWNSYNANIILDCGKYYHEKVQNYVATLERGSRKEGIENETKCTTLKIES